MVKCERLFLLGMVLIALVTFAEAQVVRESGVGSVVGMLKADDFINEFTFKSDGEQVLIADLDANLYKGPHGGGGCDHSEPCEDETCTDESEEGCTCTDDTAEDDGCTDGCTDEGGCDHTDHVTGPPGFYLEVEPLGSIDGPLCFAGRPGSPGWERDPRLVCYLESEADYLIRVRFIPKGDHSPKRPILYVLNATLRGVAESGELLEAFEASKNEFPFQD